MDNIGGPHQFRYEEAASNGAIEKGIAPLCEVLWQKGFAPLSSCEGHPVKKGVFDILCPCFDRVRPFVMFSGSVESAKSLNFLVRERVGRWMVTGSFNAKNDELMWVLEPNDIRYSKGVVTRKIINQDVELLVDCIAEFKQG